jgi:hypothetical protein
MTASMRKRDMLRYLTRVAVLVLGCTAACGAEAQSAGSPAPVKYPGLSARLEAPDTVRLSDGLTLRLLVRNDTDSQIMLPVSWEGDFAFDPIARDTEGRVVWHRLFGQYLSAVGVSRIIKPHETTTYRATWNLRDQGGVLVPPGAYRITSRLIGGRDSVILSLADVAVVIAR